MKMHRAIWLWLSLMFCGLLVACGGSTPSTTSQPYVVSTSGSEAQGFESEVTNATDLQIQIHRYAQAGDCNEAEARLMQLVRAHPDTNPASSHYNVALCFQRRPSYIEARRHYLLAAEKTRDANERLEARLQTLVVSVAGEFFREGAELADDLLHHDELAFDQRIEVLSLFAWSCLHIQDFERAQSMAQSALARARSQDAPSFSASDAARANFVLAEVLRHQSEEMLVPQATALEQHRVLEARAAKMLEAQRAYFDTIRWTHAEWAAASGYRIGAMYQGLYQAIANAPVPPPATPLSEAAMEVYRREFRDRLLDRVRPLLRHALRYWELTASMVERTGANSEWVDRLNADLNQLRNTLFPEGTGRALGSPATPAAH